MRLVFQHGWGFSGSCWRGWLERTDSPCLLGDRGYWGEPCPLDSLHPQPGFVLVTHSLGLHLLSAELLTQAALLVVVGGFAHFHGRHAADGRFSRRHLRRMLERMEKDPAGLLRDFYRDCDCGEWPINARAMRRERLTQDLLLLDQSRLDEAFCQGLPPLLLLHGRDDRIVRPERAEELAAMAKESRLMIIDQAGHGLPFTHPGRCLDLVRAVYERQMVTTQVV